MADAITVGTETPWLSGATIGGWRDRGFVVIGVFPATDQPALELLCLSSVDQLFTEGADPLVILRAIRDLTEVPRLSLSRRASRSG